VSRWVVGGESSWGHLGGQGLDRSWVGVAGRPQMK
jgi:hypothetical protein